MFTSRQGPSSPPPFLLSLSEALGSDAKDLRRAAGLSLRDVGRYCGVSHSAVSAWEEGRYAPRGLHLVAYVQLLGVLARGHR
ncbi:helix-turn-helix domain-containing protein [Ornithinimicrobium sediminis]|uniref:helix-turn-helix domain-containing protein n=1 Tax=Ornithinimicrobium sediminis TaxID=2904603 RepID=UPI0038CDBEE0